jgi:hypothetical protein
VTRDAGFALDRSRLTIQELGRAEAVKALADEMRVALQTCVEEFYANRLGECALQISSNTSTCEDYADNTLWLTSVYWARGQGVGAKHSPLELGRAILIKGGRFPLTSVPAYGD